MGQRQGNKVVKGKAALKKGQQKISPGPQAAVQLPSEKEGPKAFKGGVPPVQEPWAKAKDPDVFGVLAADTDL